jgi:hypothetical protein
VIDEEANKSMMVHLIDWEATLEHYRHMGPVGDADEQTMFACGSANDDNHKSSRDGGNTHCVESKEREKISKKRGATEQAECSAVTGVEVLLW